VTPHQRKISAIVSKLLDWYPKNARDLPWRRTKDPYRVYVSEIMLQQTQVKTVLRYWDKWMQALPDISALAAAKPGEIHKLWEGLGYYTRVRNMHAAAKVIVAEHGGRFPETYEEILALPGIGRYTAGAICSIVMEQPTPILDGNVMRVLSRVFGIIENPKEKAANEKLWLIATQLVTQAGEVACIFTANGSISAGSPEGFARKSRGAGPCSQLNQSLMELGALVCTPRQPQCADCPISRQCFAFQNHRVHELPNLARRPAATQRRYAAFVVENRGRFLVRQRPAGVVNAHMWEFPNVEMEPTNGDLQAAAREALGFNVRGLKPFTTIKHSITRYRMTLEVFRAGKMGAVANGVGGKPLKRLKGAVGRKIIQLKLGVNESNEKAGGRWMRRGELSRLAFCSAHKKILERL